MGKNENRHLLLSHCRFFLPNFYRNVPWVVFYQTYLFCYIKSLNLKKNTKINSSAPVWGLCSIVSSISFYKKIVFLIAIAHALWLLWQLKVFIDLKWEEWKLRFIAISLQIFWQKFYGNVPWVVLYQTFEFCPNCWIRLVDMATERINLWSLRSHKGDETET